MENDKKVYIKEVNFFLLYDIIVVSNVVCLFMGIEGKEYIMVL